MFGSWCYLLKYMPSLKFNKQRKKCSIMRQSDNISFYLCRIYFSNFDSNKLNVSTLKENPNVVRRICFYYKFIFIIIIICVFQVYVSCNSIFLLRFVSILNWLKFYLTRTQISSFCKIINGNFTSRIILISSFILFYPLLSRKFSTWIHRHRMKILI